MSSAEPDHRTLFLRNYELYERAKQGGEEKDVSRFALMALVEIHHISDVPAHADHEANVQVMHDLLGPLHTEAEVREKYDQLRDDAGL
jgi:hypothetical protein